MLSNTNNILSIANTCYPTGKIYHPLLYVKLIIFIQRGMQRKNESGNEKKVLSYAKNVIQFQREKRVIQRKRVLSNAKTRYPVRNFVHSIR